MRTGSAANADWLNTSLANHLDTKTSMSKKRERAKTNLDGDGAGDTIQDQDDGAESLLFQVAPSSEADTPSSSSSSRKLSSKRSKSSIADDDAASAAPAAGAGTDSAPAAASAASKYHPAAIAPSSALRQCDGFDVVRKGSRGRGRQLMVLPGALGLGNGGSGGRLGTLNNATPSRPVLYVEFPEVW